MLNYIKSALIVLWEVVKVALVSLAIILPIRYFLVQPFYVKGASMEPNFYDHDYLLIDEISFRFREPQRGEVVVFRYPKDPADYFIKRIIGLPHERLLVHDDKLYIASTGGEPVEYSEPYLGEWIRTSGSLDVTLGANQYFVLGDNRGASLDSRSFGPIDRKSIIGRVWVRAWPIDRWAVYASEPLRP
jgi:signal peptidase I